MFFSLQVYDKDQLSSDDVIGCVVVPLEVSNLPPGIYLAVVCVCV